MAPKRTDRPRPPPEKDADLTPAELEERRARRARMAARVAGSVADLAKSAGHENEGMKTAEDASDTEDLKLKTRLLDGKDGKAEAEKPAMTKRSAKVADADDDAELEKPAEKKKKTTKKSAKMVFEDQAEAADDADAAPEPVARKTARAKSKAKATTTKPKETKPKAEPKSRKKAEPKPKVEKAPKAKAPKKAAAPKKTKKTAAKDSSDDEELNYANFGISTPKPARRITMQHGKNAMKYHTLLERLEDRIVVEGEEPDEWDDVFKGVIYQISEAIPLLSSIHREAQKQEDEAKVAEEKEAADVEAAAEEERVATEQREAEAQLVAEEKQAVEEAEPAAEEEEKQAANEPAATEAAPAGTVALGLDAYAEEDEEDYEPAPAAEQNEPVSPESEKAAPTAELTNDTAAVELEAPPSQNDTRETAESTFSAPLAVIPDQDDFPAMPITDLLFSPTAPPTDTQLQEERFADQERFRFVREEEQAIPASTSAPFPAASPLPDFEPASPLGPGLGQATGYTTPTKSVDEILAELRQHAIDLGTVSAEENADGNAAAGPEINDAAELAAPAESLLAAAGAGDIDEGAAPGVASHGGDDERLFGLFTDA